MGDLKPIRLAAEPAFTLGVVSVEPASRTLRAHGRQSEIEPRTMQVLVLLGRHRGEVVGRQTLVDACWEGRIVGDDAVNRAILKLRRALDEIAGDLSIDTVARVGYRLNSAEAAAPQQAATPAVGRRSLIIGAGAAGLVALVGGSYFAFHNKSSRALKAQELYERGEIAFQQGARDDNAQAVGFFEEAAGLAPDSAPIAGALALALRFEQTFLGASVLAASTARADRATERALRLDPRDPDAIAARAMYVPFSNHWYETEQRLRAGLREEPESGVMNGFLGMVLAAVGRTKESIGALEHAVAGARFVPLLRGYLINALFADGRLGDADRELEAASALWPRYAELWWLRFWTLALTGRLDAALLHIGAKLSRPTDMRVEEADAARLAIAALASRSPAAISSAIAAWRDLAPGGWQRRATIGLAASLGRTDEALAQTRKLLAPYHEPAPASRPGSGFLFSAPLAALHQLPGFWSICDEIGLGAYWRKTGSRPDALSFSANQ